jgi:hypothetical protein
VTLRNAALGRVAQQINNPPTGAPWSPEVLDQNSSEIGILKSALAANPEAMTPELAAHLATLAGQQAKVKPPWAPGVVKLTRADGTEVEGYMKGPNDFTPFPEKIPPMSNVAEDVVDTEGNVLGKATRDTKTGKLVHQPLKPEPMVTVPLNPGELFGPTIRLPESEYLRRKAATNAPTAGVGSPPVVQGRGGRMDVIPNRPLAALRRLEDTAPPDSGAPEAAPAAAADGLPDIEVARKLALRHITRGVPADAIRQRFRQLYGEDLGGGVYSEGLGE